jgi:vitamin K-dependent gamma-carboxylase
LTTTERPNHETAAERRDTSISSGGLIARLAGATDVSWLGFLRISFGLVMVWEVCRYFANGWIDRYYREPTFFFTYWPFDFVQPWGGAGMVWHFMALGAAGLLVAAGFLYRVAAPALFVLFSYVFLLDKANYLNHFYLVMIMAFLLACLPAHRPFSLDALRSPGLRSDDVPAWMHWLIRFQVGIPYFYAGIAKFDADWLSGEPLRIWLADQAATPLIGPLLVKEPVVQAMAYGSLLFDLAVVPMLLFRRTRPLAFALAIGFHLLNSRLFSIGIFPWLMILLTTVFLPADWPKRMLAELRSATGYRLVLAAGLGFGIGSLASGGFSLIHGAVTAIGTAVVTLDFVEQRRLGVSPGRGRFGGSPSGNSINASRAVPLLLLGIWITIQLLVPLRHLAIPGNVHWTEEGHRFSWHMMARTKDGEARFVVTDPPTGTEWEVDPADWLTSRQLDEYATRPDMILQFARYLEQRWVAAGHHDVEVRVLSSVSLNGRTAQPLVDPTIDLTIHARWALPPAPWILPLADGAPASG